MALAVNDVAEVEMLNRVLGKDTSPETVKLHLFQNDHTPGEADTLSSFTEPDDSSYAAVELTAGSWTVATESGTTEASYAQQSFTLAGETPAQDYYGYFFSSTKNDDSSFVIWAEKFSDGPYTIPTGGGVIRITPKIQLA